jgi:hypothetical protein
VIIIICGSRNWKNFRIIEEFILHLPKGTVIIEGDCRGADRIAGYLGRKYGYEVIPVAADWFQYGKAAGPIRNQKMLDDYHPDCVVAFHNNLKYSKGTKDMVERAKKAGIEVQVISEGSWLCPACGKFHPKGSICAVWEVRKIRDGD